VWSYKHQWHNVHADGCGYRGDNVESIVASVLLPLSPVAVLSMVWCRGRDRCMSPEVAALVPGDVAIFVVAIVCLNADINMSGLGVNHSGAVGDCAIAGGCASGDSDCDGDVLWLCRCQGGEATEQVSYNADINICMLVNCFRTIGGCATPVVAPVAKVIATAMFCGCASARGVRQQNK